MPRHMPTNEMCRLVVSNQAIAGAADMSGDGFSEGYVGEEAQ
jgi:hypothetical protein